MAKKKPKGQATTPNPTTPEKATRKNAKQSRAVAKINQKVAQFVAPPQLSLEEEQARQDNETALDLAIPEYTGRSMPGQQKGVKVRKQYYLKHLRDAAGLRSYACVKTRISTSTVSVWMKEDEEFAEIANFITFEYSIDRSEHRLMQLRDQDKNLHVAMKATEFHLKTIGKRRGYVESVEMEVQAQVHVHMALPDNGRRPGQNPFHEGKTK